MSAPRETTESGWERRGYAGFVRFLEAVATGDRRSRLLEFDGVAAAIAPASAERALFNSVAYESAAALEASLEDLRAAYAEAGVRAWTVWAPEGDADSRRLLASRGHRLEGVPRQMRLELAGVPEHDGDLELTRNADWATLCAINDVAYELQPGSFEAGLGGERGAGMRAYGAIWAGWTASVLSTALVGSDCAVYLVATLPEARRHRLAARLLHRALLDARGRGCDSSTLQASSMGRALYERLGYCDLGGLEMWEHRVFPP